MQTRLARPSHSTQGICLGLLAALLGGSTATADAQRVGGSIGVSLTILESVATRAVALTGFRLEPDGRATLETTAPTAGRISQLVMARVSSSADGFRPVDATPVLLSGGRDEEAGRGAGAPRMRHRVDIGRTTSGAAVRDVRLRIEYLVVAGT
jgi:hypothetical protein